MFLYDLFVVRSIKTSALSPTWEICGGVVFWAGLEPEVGDGGRLRAYGHAYHVLHLVDAVPLEAPTGQLREPLALPDQDEPLRKILIGFVIQVRN